MDDEKKRDRYRSGELCGVQREIKTHCIGRASLAGWKMQKGLTATSRALAASDGRTILKASERESFTGQKKRGKSAGLEGFTASDGRASLGRRMSEPHQTKEEGKKIWSRRALANSTGD